MVKLRQQKNFDVKKRKKNITNDIPDIIHIN